MSHIKAFKQKLAAVSRLWGEEEYDTALAEIEEMIKTWPGSGHLHILWASLVQLQENPNNSLNEVKRALQRAVELDENSPAGHIELGHFLDAVEDKPRAALKAYTDGATAARRMLIEALLGQAKTFHQLGKREESLQCLVELLNLLHLESRGKGGNSASDILLESSTGRVYTLQLKGPYAERIEEVLDAVLANRSA